MAARAAEAAHVPLLKIKLGKNPDFDRLALRRIAAAAPGARLRVDANGGWSFEQARELLPELAALGVEFVEQPLAHGQPEALGALRRHSPLPIFADESTVGRAAVFVALALLGWAAGLENSNEMGLWQSLTPDRLLGRVNATRRSINRTMGAAGALAAGALAGSIGERWALVGVVVVFALAAVVAINRQILDSTVAS